jgi:hypothetical protein
MVTCKQACLKSLGVLVALVLTGSSWAQEIPGYDPATQCKRIAEVSEKYSTIIYGACIDQEQIAYNALRPRWGSVPADVRKQCDPTDRVDAGALYTRLQTCIDQEMTATRSNRKR